MIFQINQTEKILTKKVSLGHDFITKEDAKKNLIQHEIDLKTKRVGIQINLESAKTKRQ